MSEFWSAFSEADVATRRDTAIAAGTGDHLPIGYWSSGSLYRSAMRFPKPPWEDWTSIVKATLTFYISDHQHVGVRNSTIYIRRNSTASIWTKAAGTQDCEAGFSGGNNTQADDLVVSTTNQSSFASGTTANAKKSVSVTLMTREYFAADVAKLVYVFDPASSSDYTELWSREKGSTYDAELVIEYEAGTPPDYPTNVAPAVGAVVADQTPRFSWVHNSSDPQTGARVKLYADDGLTLINEYPVVGAAAFLDWPDLLNPGQTYVWQVFTSNAAGESPGSAGWSFTIAGAPVVTIPATRKMVYDAVAKVPRLVVSWTSDKPQTHYRVTTVAPAYDSGWQASAVQTLTLPIALTDNTPVNVTVYVQSGGIIGSASRSFNPRYGLTVHRRDLTAGALPTAWVNAVVDSVVPAGADLRMQYGGAATALAAPAAWFDELSQVPLGLRYVFWKALFIPAAAAGPTLNKVTINYTTGVVSVIALDKWTTTRGGAGIVAPWRVDDKEYVYGTRSANADMRGGAVASVLYSQPITLRKDRSYILTGLMKSEGNSGACIELVDKDGVVIPDAGGIIEPVGPMRTAVLVDPLGTPWFNEDRVDVVRYKTPVYRAVGTEPEVVYVALKVNGVAGSQAWFDAVKLEESSVATPWSPGALGAVAIDAGGVQVDGWRGGVFRYRGTNGGARDTVEGGVNGLILGSDTPLYAPSAGMLSGHAHATVPGVFAHGSAALALLNGTLKLDVADGGRAAMLDTANNRFIVPAGMGGVYRVTAAISAANTAAGERHIAGMSKNGAGVTSSFAYPNVGGTAGFSLALDLVLAAGDVITFVGTSTVSADWTVTAASFVQVAAAAA